MVESPGGGNIDLATFPKTTGRRRWWRHWWIWPLVAVAASVLLFVGYVGFLVYRGVRQAPAVGYQNQFSVSGLSTIRPVDQSRLVRSWSPTIGPAGAPLTVVEFGDFECPYCEESFPIIRSLVAEYGSRVRFVYRYFPLPSLHEHAMAAATAAACANVQGKFWPYHDKLYQNQSNLDDQSLQSYALQAGLDSQSFNQCFSGRQQQASVNADIADGEALGVVGTPTWFFNGRKVEGAIPAEPLRKIFETIIK